MQREETCCQQDRNRWRSPSAPGPTQASTLLPRGWAHSAFCPRCPPESSLLQEHMLPTQEVVLGEASKDVRPNWVTATLPGWGWWGQVPALFGREAIQ